jgi:hypothetical protein
MQTDHHFVNNKQVALRQLTAILTGLGEHPCRSRRFTPQVSPKSLSSGSRNDPGGGFSLGPLMMLDLSIASLSSRSD